MVARTNGAMLRAHARNLEQSAKMWTLFLGPRTAGGDDRKRRLRLQLRRRRRQRSGRRKRGRRKWDEACRGRHSAASRDRDDEEEQRQPSDGQRRRSPPDGRRVRQRCASPPTSIPPRARRSQRRNRPAARSARRPASVEGATRLRRDNERQGQSHGAGGGDIFPFARTGRGDARCCGRPARRRRRRAQAPARNRPAADDRARPPCASSARKTSRPARPLPSILRVSA